MAYTTSASLLSKVCKGDEISWEEFYNSYRSLFYDCARKHFKFNDSDIQDVIQEVMLFFFGQSKSFKYDKTKGKMSNYLRTVFYHKARQLIDRQTRRNREIVSDIEDIERLSDVVDLEFNRRWDEEWKKHIVAQVLHELKSSVEPKSFQVFYYLVVEGISPVKVAETFQMTTNNVYAIKFRLSPKVVEYAKNAIDENITL